MRHRHPPVLCISFAISTGCRVSANWCAACVTGGPEARNNMLGLMMSLVLMMGLQEQVSEPSRADTLQQERKEKATHLQKPTRNVNSKKVLPIITHCSPQARRQYLKSITCYQEDIGRVTRGGLILGALYESKRVSCVERKSSRRLRYIDHRERRTFRNTVLTPKVVRRRHRNKS